MKERICCFAGHRDVDFRDNVQKILFEKIEYLIINENVREFWVGHYGSFDRLAASCVQKIKTKYNDVKLILIIPYVVKEISEYKEEYYKDYDGILIAEIPSSTPAKYKILKCNEYMVQKSSFMICYVKFSWGGAAKTLEYAEKRKLNIINIVNKISE